jgi:heterotetrameric sarcosine oxidase delta subunit
MSLRIRCPTCGERSLEEWVHGEIFTVPESITDSVEREVDRSFFHNNTEGVVEEAWFHLYGCRRWVTVRRDTRTDAFLD